jgi:DedD protein
MLTSGIAFAVVAIALYVLLGENKTIAESWTRQLVPLAQGVTSSSSDHTRTAALPPLPPTPGAAASATDAPIKSPKGQQAANANNPPEVSPLITGSSKADGIVPSDAESERKPEIAVPINNLASSQTINKSDSRPGWTVQALATTDRNEAKNWLDRLKSKGYDAYIINAQIKGLNWYRVRVGNLDSHQEAEELGRSLRTQEV